MGRFVLAVVVEASGPEEAERFLRNTLHDGVRWDQSLPIPYVGEPCEVGVAARYSTGEIHLLCDGFRTVAAPERS